MKNITKFIMTTVTITFSQLCAASETKVLKYHSNKVKHEIHVTDNQVVGGKSQGGFSWKVIGGAYDGKNLHVTFTSTQRKGCKSWFTHVYEINEAGPRMLVTVDKCGKTRTDLNGQHYWDYVSRL